MRRTRIKFCGITRVEDALAAAELGADAIGMVLHADSPRTISRETAKRILAALPPFVTPVGLFVDASPQLILDFDLRHIQLHGNENPSVADALIGKVVIKALPVSRLSELAKWKNVSGILLDSGAGGSGIENDWQTIHKHQDAGDFRGLRIIAAGGLNPKNVAEVVKLLRPWAVDVSSGIESSPGVKSRELMTAFVEAVRQADQ